MTIETELRTVIETCDAIAEKDPLAPTAMLARMVKTLAEVLSTASTAPLVARSLTPAHSLSTEELRALDGLLLEPRKPSDSLPDYREQRALNDDDWPKRPGGDGL